MTPGAGSEAKRSPAVWVLRDGEPERVPVETGLDDDAFAEIHGGKLAAGDVILVGTRVEGSDAVARRRAVHRACRVLTSAGRRP